MAAQERVGAFCPKERLLSNSNGDRSRPPGTKFANGSTLRFIDCAISFASDCCLQWQCSSPRGPSFSSLSKSSRMRLTSSTCSHGSSLGFTLFLLPLYVAGAFPDDAWARSTAPLKSAAALPMRWPGRFESNSGRSEDALWRIRRVVLMLGADSFAIAILIWLLMQANRRL